MKSIHTNKFKIICQKHNVEKMYLFGSAVRNNLNSNSDLDFLVSFKKMELAKYFSNYIDLKEKLKNLFQKEIDLVEEQALKNPILIKAINKDKELVYG